MSQVPLHVALICISILASACTTTRSKDAAASSQPVPPRGVILSPRDEALAIDRFRKFFAGVTAESVSSNLEATYASDASFNDTLKTLHGREEIKAYFLRMAAHTDFVKAVVVDSAHSGRNYYVRWVMDVRFKGSKKTIRTIGMTHLMFDRDGRIVMHQDYWDSAAGFFEHVPVIGASIRWVKSLL